MAVRGRYRPVLTGMAIAVYIPWRVLPPRGWGARTIEVVIVDVCLAVMCQQTTGQAQQRRVWILGEAPTKVPLKRGRIPINFVDHDPLRVVWREKCLLKGSPCALRLQQRKFSDGGGSIYGDNIF